MTSIVLGLATFTTAMVAGLMYAYSCSVNMGLAKLSDREYLAAMQSINSAIQNPLFFVTFLGALILTPMASYMVFHQKTFLLVLTATILYFAGVFVVTVAGNVPLNEALAIANLETMSTEEISMQRTNFENRWNMLHAIRTVACVISSILWIIACLPHGRCEH